MPRANAMVPPDAIRIEEEVWQEAFARREPARPNRRRRLEAVDGGGATRVTTDNATIPARQRAVEAAPPTSSATPTAAGAGQSRADAALGMAPAFPSTVASVPAAQVATAPAAQVASVPAAQVATAPAAQRPRAAVDTLASTSAASPPARRTVKIQGRGAERNLPVPAPSRRSPTRRPYERAGFRPDRVAMWAVVLGFVLILVAVASGHG